VIVAAQFEASGSIPLGVIARLFNDFSAPDEFNLPNRAYPQLDTPVDLPGIRKKSTLSRKIDSVRALFNHGYALETSDRKDDAVKIYDAVILKFQDASELPLQETVARALLNKGCVLGQTERRDEAIHAYDDLIDRLNAATDLDLNARSCLHRATHG
jgi:tetratricopeptide (TPR) repeat protein